jgi:hypothetical protein
MSIWNKKNTGKPDLTDNARSSIDLIADRIDNVEKGLAGDDNLKTIDINGGTIDGTPIGATTPDDGTFNQVDVDNININGNTISSTDTNGDINITPNGTGEVVINGNITCNSISTDGNDAIKIKTYTGTTSPVPGLTSIAHGLDATKIIFVQGNVHSMPGYVPFDRGSDIPYSWDATNVTLAINSDAYRNKTYRMFIGYV